MVQQPAVQHNDSAKIKPPHPRVVLKNMEKTCKPFQVIPTFTFKIMFYLFPGPFDNISVLICIQVEYNYRPRLLVF